MRNISPRMKNEFKKFLYSGNTPTVKITHQTGFVGGTEGRFGTTTGGTPKEVSISKKCHAVVLATASRTIFEVGIFNEGSVMFMFDRDDASITFDQWEDPIIKFEEIDYFVDPVKMKKAAGHLITLSESSMATILIGEIKI